MACAARFAALWRVQGTPQCKCCWTHRLNRKPLVSLVQFFQLCQSGRLNPLVSLHRQSQQTAGKVDPDVMAGKPVVPGTRILVDLVLKRLALNLDLNALFTAYPRLTKEDVRAYLAYANTPKA